MIDPDFRRALLLTIGTLTVSLVALAPRPAAAKPRPLLCAVAFDPIFLPAASSWRAACGDCRTLPFRPRTRLTIGIQRRLTKPFQRRFRGPTAFCRRRNRGCHPSCQIIQATWITAILEPSSRRLQRRRRTTGRKAAVIASIFAGVRPWRGNRLRRRKRPGPCPAPAPHGATSWSGSSGPWFRKVRLVTMASGATMQRSAFNRAGSAAGGTGMAPSPRRADTQSSGTGTTPCARRRVFPSASRLPVAGRKHDNAQQNADRRLPPGGNTRRCRSR